MTIGHNGSPPLAELSDGAFRVWVKMILGRDDLTSMQKLLAVAIGHEANPEWAISYSNDQIKKLISVSQRETIYEATRKLVEKGIIARERVPGSVSTYRILPPHVVESIVAAYEARKAKPKAQNDQETLLDKPADQPPPPLRLNQHTPLLDKPADGVLGKPADGVLGKPSEGVLDKPAMSGKPAGFSQQGSASRAYRNNNNLPELEDRPENNPLNPPSSFDPGFVFEGGELRLVNGTAQKFANDFPGIDLQKICDRVAGRVVELGTKKPNEILALIRAEARKETDSPRSKPSLAMPPKSAWDGAKLREIAEKQGISVEQGRLEFEAFKAHHLAKGSKFKDWYRAWQTWCLNHAKRGYGRKIETPSDKTATGMNYDWVLKTYGNSAEGAK